MLFRLKDECSSSLVPHLELLTRFGIIADEQATANAALGDLVRKMTIGWSLVCGGPDVWYVVVDEAHKGYRYHPCCKTPKAALEAALKGVEVPK